MTKFSYSQKRGKYIISEIGTIVDEDDDEDALLIRHGMMSVDEGDEDEDALDAIASAEDDDLLRDFGALPDLDLDLSDTDALDDLEVIREFLESDP